MPFPGEHAARQVSPDMFIRFRRENDALAPGVHVIWGVTREGDAQIQSIRFDAKKFTAAEAVAWLKEHDFKAEVEEAEKEETAAAAVIAEVGEPFIKASTGFLKTVAKVRKYVKGDRTYNITPEVLTHWAKTFQEMKANGVKVPVQMGHNDNAEGVGWVDGLFVDDGVLVARLALAEDKMKLVESNDVSIFAPIQHKDGEGRMYQYPIQHIALTPTPLFPGLGDFVQIAASQVPVFIDKPTAAPEVVALQAELKTVNDKVTALEASLQTVRTEKTALDTRIKELQASLVKGPKTGPQVHVLPNPTVNTDAGGIVAACERVAINHQKGRY